MRTIAQDNYKGRNIRILGNTVTEQFIGGQSASYEDVSVTINGVDVSDQVIYIGTSDPKVMIANARELIDGGLY